MKTVIYESDHVYECAMPAIGKRFVSGEEVVLTDEQAEIALTNASIRLAGEPAPAKAPAADAKVSAAFRRRHRNASLSAFLERHVAPTH